VRKVEALGLDTYALEDRYYSYRRATHRIEPTWRAAQFDWARQLARLDARGKARARRKSVNQSRRPKDVETHIGNHKLDASTLMMAMA
jgi:hypothetical protein